MSRYVDSFAPVSPDEAKFLKSDGFEGACRYLAAYTNPQWGKGMTVQEAEAIHAAGLAIIPNYEGDPTRPGYFTVDQAKRDGANAATENRHLGIPHTVPTWFSVDCDLHMEAELAALIPYFEGIAEEFPKDQVATYGSDIVLEFLRKHVPWLRGYWQTAAWSNNVRAKFAALYQDKFGVRLRGLSVDVDEVRGDPHAWMPEPVKAVAPVHEWRIYLPNKFSNHDHALEIQKEIDKLGVRAEIQEVI